MAPLTKAFTEFASALPIYLNSLRDHTEATRRQRFLQLLRDFFGVEADELEQTLTLGGVGARVAGRIDALAGNVILEFKDTLTHGKLEDAKVQLLKYARGLEVAGDTRRYTLVATDGAVFQALYWDGASSSLTDFTSRTEFTAEGWKQA